LAHWVPYLSGAVPVYANAALVDRSIEVVRNLDVTSLIGADIYVAYGLSDTDMAANNKYAKVYTIIANTIPTVSTTTIHNGGVDISTNATVGATFSEPMDSATSPARPSP
jgi:hypothetical protein